MTSTADIVAIRARMGTGKTYAAALMAEASPLRLCVLSIRLSLTGAYKQLYKGIKAYLDIEGPIKDDVGRIIIQPESLYRLKWTNREQFILYIDEASQIRRQLTGDTFRKQDTAKESFANFKWAVRYATKIIVMDANLTAADVRFFDEMRGGGSTIETYWNTHDLFAGRTQNM